MFGLGIWELLIILFIVLLVFGSRLPDVGVGLGKAIKGFRKTIKEPDEIDVTPKQEKSERKKEGS